ncbi:DUF2946 domain-containing protein [Marinomonas sp. RSW2]|uniref:DUF2946 domain-containing protein n=1 Tax=Marinomonas maritima TaxID=2940935 RepID=A0ABT5WE05_9GAMM|nr:DUF2946 domain-containing protein [Marinomonas maritima]MDE8603050.1 DUF2946 domain-containing protein [Marinomonas maritima]
MHFQLKRPNTAHTQSAVCVCLFAVFLIYFAPLYSQVANAFSPEPTIIKNMAMEVMATENMSTAEHDHSQMMPQKASNSSAHDGHHGHHAEGESTNVLEACGYCSLLFHLNWIDAKAFELIPLTQSRYPTIVTMTISHTYPVPFTSIQPRAPPAITI